MRRAFIASLERELAFLRASPWDLALATWIPLLLMAVVSWQISAAVLRELPIAVVDDDQSTLSRTLVRKLDAAPAIEVTLRPATLEAAWRLARRGQVYAVVYIPAQAAREALRGERATVLAYYNATFTAAGTATARDIGSAVQALNVELARSQTAAIRGPGAVHAPPLRVQSTLLHNPQGSYELMLVSLLHPALLHLLLCVCAIGAVGRELRDGTAGDWLACCDRHALAAVLGKLAPYVLAFTAYALLASLYMSKLRGWPFAGSAALMVLAQLLLMTAYAAAGVLFVGLTKTMSQALSFAGLYAGASFAFAGAFFPTTGASWVVQAWSAALPFTHFARLQAQQFSMGAPLALSLPELGTLCLFIVAFGVPGSILYINAARRPEDWGRR